MKISKVLDKSIDYVCKTCKIAYWFAIFGVTAWLIYLISKECYYETQWLYHKLVEKTCYCLCVFCLYNVYYLISEYSAKN